MEFRHQFIDDYVMYDPETGEHWTASLLITTAVVGEVEHGCSVTARPDTPRGMTAHVWSEHRRRMNEIALTNRLREQGVISSDDSSC